MSAVLQDLRYAARLMRSSPGSSAVVILTLGLAIGANTAIFSVLDAVWLQAVPFPNADRLAAVWNGTGQSSRVLPSSTDLETWREFPDIFEDLTGIATTRVRVRVASDLPEVLAARVDQRLFSIVSVRPVAGRLLTAADWQPGAPTVGLISERVWNEQLGRDPDVIGRPVDIRSPILNAPVVIVGVLPHGLSSLFPSDIVLPSAAGSPDARTRRPVRVIGLLRAGVGVEQAQSMMEARPPADPVWRPVVVSLRDSIVGADVGLVLKLLWAAVALVLLIGCANVANLLLARLADRGREIAVRAAMGASRSRLALQVIIESLMFATLGAACGLLLAYISRPLLVSMVPDRIPGLDAVGIDPRVLGYTIAITGITALLAALWPILRASRADAGDTLSGRTPAGATGGGASRVLLTVEVGLSLVAIVAAGVLMRSFVRLVNVDPGFNPEGVVTFRARVAPRTDPPAAGKGVGRLGLWDPSQLQQGIAILEALRALPSVQAAGAIGRLPFGGGPATYTIRLEARELETHEDPWVQVHRATPGYFGAMGIEVRRGRTFRNADRIGAPGVVVVNELAAQRFWPAADPLGQRIYLGSDEALTVIGVVANVRQVSLSSEPVAEIYRSWFQEPGGLTYVVRTSRPGLLRELSAPGASIAGMPITDVRRLHDHVRATVREPRARMLFFTLAGALVLVLTVVGVAGVTAHSVSRRTREIGIRVALGARPEQIVMLVMGHTAVAVGAGIPAGLLASWWGTRYLESLVFAVPVRDSVTTVAGTSVLLVAALAAAWLPARRAAALQPAVTLRSE